MVLGGAGGVVGCVVGVVTVTVCSSAVTWSGVSVPAANRTLSKVPEFPVTA